MTVVRITSVHQPSIVAVLEDLLDRAKRGDLTSIAYIAERLERDPLIGVVGRYREHPTRLLGEMAVMKIKLAKYASRKRDDYEQTMM